MVGNTVGQAPGQDGLAYMSSDPFGALISLSSCPAIVPAHGACVMATK